MENIGTVLSRRVPPHSAEAERSVLAGLLLDNRALDRVSDLNLTSDDFYSEANQKIFYATQELLTKGAPADLITVSNALRTSGVLDKIGGAGYLSSLLEYEFSSLNVPHYAKIIKEKAVLRNLIQTINEISQTAADGIDDYERFLDDAEKRLFQITSQKQNNAFDPLKDILLRNFAQIESSAAQKDSMIGVPSGFHDLDKHTNGWQPSHLVIVAARPGMGKTSFMLNLALSCAIEKKQTVAIFSMEMSKEELSLRLLSTESRVDSYRLKTGRLQEEDWKKLQKAAGSLAECPVFIDDTPALNILEIKSRCRRLQSQYGLGLVIVDYLQLMRGLSNRGMSTNREQEIAEISRGLKALAKELKVPVIAASQLNRGVESRNDKRPMLSDLRESGAIEQDADMVLFIHREEQYNQNDPDIKGIAEVIIGKHRSGQTGVIKLAWLGQYTAFENLAE